VFENFGESPKPGHRSYQFLKFSVKMSENQENLTEMYREIGNIDKSTGFTYKLTGFFRKSAWRFSNGLYQKPANFCRESVN
jgi:hypothetical protein